MKEGELSFNEGTLYYEVLGSGEPIVFIHGFTLDHRVWEPQREYFSREYKVITYDTRGFGKSSVPVNAYTHHEDLAALLDELKAGAAHIVGHSMGGRIAANFTLDYPAKVLTLTLLDSALDGYESEVNWTVRSGRDGVSKAKENWLNHEVFEFTKRDKKTTDSLKKIVGDYSGWHWFNGDPQRPSEPPAIDRLSEISVPTLIVVGEEDLQYFHNIAAAINERVEGSVVRVVKSAGHMVNLEQHEEVNKLVKSHIG